MNCERCGIALVDGQVYSFEGKSVCEDCCFDLMNPPKVCDPTAVSSTLTVRKQLGQSGINGLTELQKQIYKTVTEREKISRQELLEVMKLTPQELEKQFVILRHCELLKSFKEGNIIYLAKY
jgi:hypothetical protein